MCALPSSSGPRDGLAFLLAQIGAHAAMRFAERLEPLKLNPADAGILRVLAQEQGMSQQRLATVLGMFPSRLVLVLDELEKAGLIERRESAADRRVYALNVTSRGKEVLRAIGQVAREHREALVAALTPTEQETLARLLARIAAEQQLTPGVHPGFRQLGKRRPNAGVSPNIALRAKP
jgi:DNA-binding MarR family transcriptional regulator